MSAGQPDLEKDMISYLVSSGADKVADYAARGRKFEDLSIQDLTIAWGNAISAMADDLRDKSLRTVESDLRSEFSLRKLSPPHEAVLEQANRYFAEVTRAIDRLQAENPAQFEELSDRVEADVARFRATRDKDQN